MGVTNLDSLTLSGTLIAPSIIGTVASNSAVVATADDGTTQTLTAAMVVGGGAWTFHTTTGGTTPSLTLPTAANLIAGISGWAVGDSYVLRIINANSGTATIVTNTGITLTGTATVSTNSEADFVVTYASAGAVTVVRASKELSTNGLTITASTGTLTIANSSSLITSGANAITLTSTGTTGVTLPTTGTLATLAGSEVLTNKTLTAPTINGVVAGTTTSQTFTAATVTTLAATTVNGNTITTGTGTLTLAASVTATGPATSGTLALNSPPPQAVGSSLPITAAMSGKPILLDTVGGSTATLPAATGSGNKYRFFVTATTTSNAHKILAASSSDFINGIAMGFTGSTAKVFASAAATNHSIQMPFAGSQPSGGFIGDWFEFVDVATNLWTVEAQYQAGTTPTTPFSSATS